MDLQLTEDKHDMQVVNYDLALVSGLRLVQQRIKQSLFFFYGEWYLDVTDGVPYYSDILIKNPVRITVESVLKNTILAVPNVQELTKFELVYINDGRRLFLQFAVKTDFGNLELSEEL